MPFCMKMYSLGFYNWTFGWHTNARRLCFCFLCCRGLDDRALFIHSFVTHSIRLWLQLQIRIQFVNPFVKAGWKGKHAWINGKCNVDSVIYRKVKQINLTFIEILSEFALYSCNVSFMWNGCVCCNQDTWTHQLIE